MIKKVELDFHGRPLSIEVGKIAKQADGAALVRYGETVVLVTAVAARELKSRYRFLPLDRRLSRENFCCRKDSRGLLQARGSPLGEGDPHVSTYRPFYTAAFFGRPSV